MKTARQPLFRRFFAGVWATLLLVLITNARAAERQVLRGHVVRAVTELSLQPVGRLASSTNLDLVIGLPLRNQEALTNLLQQQYAPTSPQFHHWLTPEEFTAKFGPTEQDYQAVIAFAEANGLAVTGTHPNRTLVDVRGSVADIERTFRVTLLAYQHPTEDREFYAPDVEPSLDLTVPILHITGLDNYIVPRPVSIRETPQTNAADATPASGSGPSGSYMGYDFRSAYVPGVSLNGSGQVVGLVEFDGYYPNDITEYESQARLPNVPLQNVLVGGFSGIPTANAVQVQEVSLDIEMAISMAPGLSAVVVYEAPNGNSTTIDVLNRIATDNLAKQISCSWGIADATTKDQIYQQYAAQGQSFFKSSGDNGAYISLWLGQQQADSPYITLVGGTTLTTTGPEGTWLSETVWNFNTGTGLGETNGASGGGISTAYAIPWWQTNVNMTFNNEGSTFYRNVPDVAMVASGIYVIYNNGSTASDIGGTSCAAPLWAGFTALVNQQATAQGQTNGIGFINPAIYAIGTGPTYAACFHDIIIGNNKTYYSPFQFSAVSGYDLCTGWGTPTGSNLVNVLLPLPDLTKSSDSLNNTSPLAGETVNASITITNQPCPGGGAAAGPFHVGFYGLSANSSFSGASPFHETPVSGCPAGGTVSVNQPIRIDPTTPQGTYYLGYKINDLNEVAECDESNNGIYYWTLTVPCTYVINTSSSPSGGGTTSGGGPTICGSSVTVNATANACYQFVNWTEGGAVVSTLPSYTFTPTGSGNLVANFATTQYTIATSSAPSGGGGTSGGGTVNCGLSVTVFATPLAGDSFVNWTEGGTVVSMSPSYTFTATGNRILVANFTCAFSISQSFNSGGAAGGVAFVGVTAGPGCAWTATSNVGWITITGGNSGTGNGTVSYSVAANTSTSERTGTMTIAGQTFTVNQAACPCTLNATSITLPTKGGSKTVTVKGTDCTWTATSNDSFITITKGASGIGNGKVGYTVPGNTNTAALTGTMTIAGQTFTVNQAAGGCTFSLSPKSGKFKASGGSKTVKVKPSLSDCAWTAVSNDAFITITAGASGVGNGTVNYTVAANTNGTALTGTITIGGQTFKITQTGAP
jgi:hypothetical protein